MKTLIIISLLFCLGCITNRYDVIAFKAADAPFDVVEVPAGSTIETPDDLFFVEQDGLYYSNQVLDEVFRIKKTEDLTPDFFDRLAKKLGITK